jgi:hypothetical protein
MLSRYVLYINQSVTFFASPGSAVLAAKGRFMTGNFIAPARDLPIRCAKRQFGLKKFLASGFGDQYS